MLLLNGHSYNRAQCVTFARFCLPQGLAGPGPDAGHLPGVTGREVAALTQRDDHAVHSLGRDPLFLTAHRQLKPHTPWELS